MSSSQVIIGFGNDRVEFEPGETLRAECSVDPAPGEDVVGLEWSALWRTEGKGDEDSETLAEEHDSAADGDCLDPLGLKPFEVRLPPSPLSYNGVVVKIRWFARAIVRLRGGGALEGQAEFQLGAVAAAQEVDT